ncbi:MAG: iron-sulfur cluster assembly protein IscA, partial [Magnetococcales bacterium]|nr:iron-sulfur cluster assembly protein IscA [Magnetococcales bacterium]
MHPEAPGITISESAAKKVREMLNNRGTPQAAVRIGITTAGC